MPAPVAIAVVSWNTRELLRACLVSIEPEVSAGRAEVWVVDNCSADGSAELVRSEFPWAGLIASGTNLGFGAAVNLVAERTDAPWLAPANADIELRPGALAGLLAAGTQDPRAGAIAPRLVLGDGTTQHSVHPFPTLRFTIAFNLGLAALTPGLADRFALEGRWNPERARTVDWAMAAFLLVRREAWDAIGGFDPAMWMYAEDLDLGWRLAAAGWHTRFEPAAVVSHRGAASTSQVWGEQVQARWTRSTYAWMLRRHGPLRTRATALVNTVGAAARVLWLAGPALVQGGERRERWKLMRRWTRLHLSNLVSSRAELERHR
jgi:N-acetylglucosaminyl-diphospho-decaprenol L-rhamnosyltransferase